MLKSFWFYFLIIPVVISTIALNSMFVHKSPTTPILNNALEYCQNKDNNIFYSDRGTAQNFIMLIIYLFKFSLLNRKFT